MTAELAPGPRCLTCNGPRPPRHHLVHEAYRWMCMACVEKDVWGEQLALEEYAGPKQPALPIVDLSVRSTDPIAEWDRMAAEERAEREWKRTVQRQNDAALEHAAFPSPRQCFLAQQPKGRRS